MQQLYDQSGDRKYLTPSGREALLKAADAATRVWRQLLLPAGDNSFSRPGVLIVGNHLIQTPEISIVSTMSSRRIVEFNLLYSMRSSLALTFKQSILK